MNHAGEILPLARLARPDVALITNVEAVHVGHLGSVEAIADEKLAIQDGLADGTLVLPRDSAMFARLCDGARHAVRSFGRHAEADDRLLDVRADAGGLLARGALHQADARRRGAARPCQQCGGVDALGTGHRH